MTRRHQEVKEVLSQIHQAVSCLPNMLHLDGGRKVNCHRAYGKDLINALGDSNVGYFMDRHGILFSYNSSL